MKFFTAVVATFGALFGAAHAQGTNTTLPKCEVLNYTNVTANIASLNAVIDTAVQLNLLKKLLINYDPITVVDNRLDAIPFSVLGIEFALTPIIKKLNATGVATLVPRHVKVSNATTLEIGVNFNGSLAVDGTFSFEIAQLNKQWWQICWTSILDPSKCPPIAVDVDVAVELEKPDVGFNATTVVQMCPKTAPKGTCSDVTVSSISIAAITGNFATLVPRILRKLTSAAIDSLSISVEQVKRLAFSFPSAGPLIKALGEKLLGYTTTEINKKGSLYKDIISVVNSLGKTLINRLLAEELAPQFVGNCYNVGIGDN